MNKNSSHEQEESDWDSTVAEDESVKKPVSPKSKNDIVANNKDKDKQKEDEQEDSDWDQSTVLEDNIPGRQNDNKAGKGPSPKLSMEPDDDSDWDSDVPEEDTKAKDPRVTVAASGLEKKDVGNEESDWDSDVPEEDVMANKPSVKSGGGLENKQQKADDNEESDWDSDMPESKVASVKSGGSFEKKTPQKAEIGGEDESDWDSTAREESVKKGMNSSVVKGEEEKAVKDESDWDSTVMDESPAKTRGSPTGKSGPKPTGTANGIEDNDSDWDSEGEIPSSKKQTNYSVMSDTMPAQTVPTNTTEAARKVLNKLHTTVDDNEVSKITNKK